MKVKELEKALIDYAETKDVQEHKLIAMRELRELTKGIEDYEKFYHIRFIINNYPDYDHFLIKLSDKTNSTWFFHFGISKEELKRFDKKDIHKLAKSLHKLYGRFDMNKKEH